VNCLKHRVIVGDSVIAYIIGAAITFPGSDDHLGLGLLRNSRELCLPRADRNADPARNPDERFENILDRIPMHRPATADEQARAIRFLASEEASYLTGVILNVDGGSMALKSLFPPRPESTVKQVA
jgi:hypothetical protein